MKCYTRVLRLSDTVAGEAIALADLTLLASVVPRKFIGLWNNFKAAAEKGGMAHPTHPLYFFKAVTSLSGPGAKVTMPAAAGRPLLIQCLCAVDHMRRPETCL